jgi:hypothetical protein
MLEIAEFLHLIGGNADSFGTKKTLIANLGNMLIISNDSATNSWFQGRFDLIPQRPRIQLQAISTESQISAQGYPFYMTPLQNNRFSATKTRCLAVERSPEVVPPLLSVFRIRTNR